MNNESELLIMCKTLGEYNKAVGNAQLERVMLLDGPIGGVSRVYGRVYVNREIGIKDVYNDKYITNVHFNFKSFYDCSQRILLENLDNRIVEVEGINGQYKKRDGSMRYCLNFVRVINVL